ncbi:FtsW/RodA/SpoVE family cell cycle protein, partial [Vibrio parahaemolyticus]|nr:FtsW/RodA/SpoVE family cell cycle protein [Vibrio parahaemolyticus]
LSLVVMLVLAQLSPRTYESLAPLMFVGGVILLFGVLFFGEASKGAQRWLNLGFVRFQPSELLKLAVPLMVARYVGRQPLPPTLRTLIVALIMVCLPTILIAKQPDLGTSILIAASGIFVIFLAGISWKIIAGAAIALGGFIPILWFFLMREDQKVRVRTLFNPESDPLGAGYHI